MTTELEPTFQGDPEIIEHSSRSRAKKVIPGPMTVPPKSDDPSRSAPAVQATSGTVLTLAKGKAYRLIASVDVYFRLSQNGVGNAAAGDIYLPAKTPITIVMANGWNTVQSLDVAGSGIIQAVEVQ